MQILIKNKPHFRWNRKETMPFVFDPSTTVDLITAQVLSGLLVENETLKQYPLEEYRLKVGDSFSIYKHVKYCEKIGAAIKKALLFGSRHSCS